MKFSKLKYLALGTALCFSGSLHANLLTKQPNLGKIVKEAGAIGAGSCHPVPIYITHVILERTDDDGKFLGYSYHIIKKGNEETLVDFTFDKWVSEKKFDKLLEEFEPYPFAFVTENVIYENETPRSGINFEAPVKYSKEKKVCDDVQRILREERVKEARPSAKERA